MESALYLTASCCDIVPWGNYFRFCSSRTAVRARPLWSVCWLKRRRSRTDYARRPSGRSNPTIATSDSPLHQKDDSQPQCLVMLFALAPERRQLASPPRIKAAVEVDASVRRSVERLATLAAATILPMQSEAALSGPIRLDRKFAWLSRACRYPAAEVLRRDPALQQAPR